MIPILANTEKVMEEKSEDGAEHVVERKCSLHVDVPYLLKKVSPLVCLQTEVGAAHASVGHYRQNVRLSVVYDLYCFWKYLSVREVCDAFR